jgi:hypothetical protein
MNLDTESLGSFNVIEVLFSTLYSFTFSWIGSDTAILLKDLWWGIYVMSIITTPILVAGFWYARTQHHKVMHEEEHRHLEEAARFQSLGSRNERWQEVLDLVNSDDPKHWRLAIMEGDIMLDELLKRSGFIGDTLGERLKSADPATFRMLDEAWEAHRVRNQVAHEGSDFILSQREARRAVELYRKVLEAYNVI